MTIQVMSDCFERICLINVIIQRTNIGLSVKENSDNRPTYKFGHV